LFVGFSLWSSHSPSPSSAPKTPKEMTPSSACALALKECDQGCLWDISKGFEQRQHLRWASFHARSVVGVQSMQKPPLFFCARGVQEMIKGCEGCPRVSEGLVRVRRLRLKGPQPRIVVPLTIVVLCVSLTFFRKYFRWAGLVVGG
jgi:hypothetical protein